MAIEYANARNREGYCAYDGCNVPIDQTSKRATASGYFVYYCSTHMYSAYLLFNNGKAAAAH